MGVWGVLGTRFSNFRFTPMPEADALSQIDPPPAASVPRGTLTAWSVSDVVSADSVAARALLDDQTTRSWVSLAAEPDGLVNVARVRGKHDPSPTSQARDRVAVRTTIHADTPRRVKLIFGYSDDALIGLNGQPVFAGTAGFRSRSPLFQGMVGWHDAVYLDLQRGANETRLRAHGCARRLGPARPPRRPGRPPDCVVSMRQTNSLHYFPQLLSLSLHPVYVTTER